jgi:hypothetical protein
MSDSRGKRNEQKNYRKTQRSRKNTCGTITQCSRKSCSGRTTQFSITNVRTVGKGWENRTDITSTQMNVKTDYSETESTQALLGLGTSRSIVCALISWIMNLMIY